jgi:hypothetical protein
MAQMKQPKLSRDGSWLADCRLNRKLRELVSWRKIAIAFTDLQKGEWKAQDCDI